MTRMTLCGATSETLRSSHCKLSIEGPVAVKLADYVSNGARDAGHPRRPIVAVRARAKFHQEMESFFSSLKGR